MTRLDSHVIAWHTIAAFVQAVSFGLLLGFYLDNSWGIRENSVKGQLSLTKVFAHEALLDIRTYDLFPILITIPAIAFVSHVAQILLIWLGDDDSWFKKDYLKGSNQIRWLEYAISATLQTWIIAQLAGSVNILINIVVAILGNIALQLFGYLHERANMNKFTILREDFKNIKLNWLWFILGFVLFALQWAWLMWSFFVAVDKADEAVPAFVTVVFFVTLGLFALFAVVMLMRSLGVSWFYPVDAYEIWYIVLSLVAKLAIDWIVFFGIAAAF